MVVGGGYIGIEMAEAMVNRGLSVTVLTRSREPMATLDPDMGRLVHEAMEGLGIDVRTSVTLRGFEVDDAGHVRAVATDDGTFPCDARRARHRRRVRRPRWPARPGCSLGRLRAAW